MARPNTPICLLPIILQLGHLITITIAAQIYTREQEFDRILNLPGQPSIPPISQFSGYIDVDQERGRALFYWFFEAQSNPSRKPLLLWLNGGPGCSSILGEAVELGPLRVKSNGTGLEFNKHAWNKDANLLFLESPAGVGFSYSNTSSDISEFNDALVAEDSYKFLVNWLRGFPQYQANDFYIAGESYAGHYVPQLAEIVSDRNKEKDIYPFINLKGFMVGNPETNDYYDMKGMVDFAWSHTVISDEMYEHLNRVCDFQLSQWSNDCNEAMGEVYRLYQKIDMYNIYAPTCVARSSGSSALARIGASANKIKMNGLRSMRIYRGYDPCFLDNVADYLNRPDVQKSLHASVMGNKEGKWKSCSGIIFQTYNFTVFSVLPIYTKLIKRGLKIWVYSGDTDGRVPTIGTRYCMEALGLPVKSPWRYWYHHDQVGGRVMEYKGLTLATVKGAGHLVPFNKPSEALLLINSFLRGLSLPAKK